jgi:D-xylose transport system ATP-binding protein
MTDLLKPDLLRMRAITKDFPGTRALDGVDLELRSGEVLALMGENGAGKSTLMKILSGVWPSGSFGGEILRDGNPVNFEDTRNAHRAGIAMIHQELALFPELTVAEHLVLDQLPAVIDWDPIYRECQQFLDRLDFGLRADQAVKTLSIGARQLVEIARALYRNAAIIVFDEPTSALSEKEVLKLYSIIRKLKSEGRGILYITHRMDEVFELSDRVLVLRDGKSVATFDRAERNELEPRLVAAMVGREIKDVFPQKNEPSTQTVLHVQDLSLTRPSGKKRLHEINFEVRAGEILGFAGLLGSGRSEILESLFGYYHADGPKGSGFKVEARVSVAGQEFKIGRPVDSLRAGIAFLSEDRKGSGLMLGQSILTNLGLARLSKQEGSSLAPLRDQEEWERSKKWIADLRVKCTDPLQSIGHLSGGNQQKVVLAKWLETEPKVIFLDEPTRGVDIGAKAEIYQWIQKLASQGLGVVLVSSELPELIGLAHRILVLREGRISAEIPLQKDLGADIQERILEAASL